MLCPVHCNTGLLKVLKYRIVALAAGFRRRPGNQCWDCRMKFRLRNGVAWSTESPGGISTPGSWGPAAQETN